MAIEKEDVLSENLLNDVINVKNRLNDYDWDYRLERFENKIHQEQEKVTAVLKEIKLSD